MLSLGLDLSLSGNGGAGSAAAFDPAMLFDGDTGFVFDFSDGSTIFQETSSPSTASGNGDPIGTVLDLSGNGNHISAATDANRPTYSSDGYGSFDGSDDYLTAAFTLNQTLTLVFSARAVGSIFFDILIAGGATSASISQDSGANVLTLFCGGVVGAIPFSNGEDFVITARASGATSRIAKNSGSYTTGNAGATNFGGITLGARNDGVNPCEARFYRAIGIGRDLNDDEITAARIWCAAPAGIAL